MNKKGQFLPIIAILSIFLLGYTFYVLVLVGHGPANWHIGEKNIKWLVQKEVKLKEIDFYYEQAFKNAIFKTISEISENGAGKRDLIWDENPYPKVKEVFKNTLEKNFRFYLKKMDFSDNQYYESDYEVVLPKDFEIKVEDGEISLNFKDKLILRDRALDEDYLIMVSKRLEYGYKFKIFSLGIFNRAYNEFSKSNECKGSDIFKNIECVSGCAAGVNSLSYKIQLEREGFIVPDVRFKIPVKC